MAEVTFSSDDIADDAALRALLEGDGRAFIDRRAASGVKAEAGGLALVLATDAAFRLGLGEVLLEGLRGRGASEPGVGWDGVLVALQEALGNALMHGNLELGPKTWDTVEAFVAYNARTTERLEDPEHGHRPLVLSADWRDGALSIRVRDVGPGFDPDTVAPVDLEAASGRGIAMIRSLAAEVAFHDGGRCIEMVFA